MTQSKGRGSGGREPCQTLSRSWKAQIHYLLVALNLSSTKYNIKTHSTKSTSPETQPKSTVDLDDVSGNVHFDVAGRFKVVSTDGTDLTTAQSTTIFSTMSNMITADTGSMHLSSSLGHYETSKVIHMNGPAAVKATAISGISLQVDYNDKLIVSAKTEQM